MFLPRLIISPDLYLFLTPDKLNLPGAEVLTCPESVNGTLIVDGLISGMFVKKYGKLGNYPVKIIINNDLRNNPNVMLAPDFCLLSFVPDPKSSVALASP